MEEKVYEYNAVICAAEQKGGAYIPWTVFYRFCQETQLFVQYGLGALIQFDLPASLHRLSIRCTGGISCGPGKGSCGI